MSIVLRNIGIFVFGIVAAFVGRDEPAPPSSSPSEGVEASAGCMDIERDQMSFV